MRSSTTDPIPEEDRKPAGAEESASESTAGTEGDGSGRAGSGPEPGSPALSDTDTRGSSELSGAGAGDPPDAGGTPDETVGDFDTLPPGEAPPSDSLELWQDGQQVAGRFRIQRLLGQGGMGKVYLAQDEMLGRAVALKRIPPEIIFDGDARDDLRHEANRLLDLAHENIVRIHTYYDGPTWPFIAMEMLQGPTLKKLLYQRRQQRAGGNADSPLFSADEVRCIARQVARGLHYAHAKGIVHRDLKPSNLMLAEPPDGELSDEDTIKITDFGISRVVADSTLRQTGKQSGTLPYMSPEQYRGEVCTAQSDLYSLGCSLYELSTGSAPFRTGDIGYQVMHVSPKAPAGLPRPMARAILRAMAKKPHQRFSSVDEFLAALEGRASGWRGGRVRVLSRLAGAAAVLVSTVVLLWALAAFVGRSTTTDSPAVNPVSPSPAPVVTRAADADLTQYGEELRLHLEEHIPRFIGPQIPQASWSDEGLSFTVPLLENTNRRGVPIDRLYFDYYREGQGWDQLERKVVEARELDAASTFVLTELEDGNYVLRASAVVGAGSKELFRSPLRFQVDTAAPQVELRPVAMEDFVDTEAPTEDEDEDSYTTFHETVRLRVMTTGTDEIASAAYRLVYGKGRQLWTTLEAPYEWSLVNSPGVTTSYEVRVEDHAGNQSTPKRLRIRRLDLALERFELAAPVVGNLARIEGALRVEGDQLPALRYLVNGEVTEPLEHSLQLPEPALVPPVGNASAADTEVDPERDTLAVRRLLLKATLRLPRASDNRIDLKYVWSGGDTQSFARSMPIYSIDMRPPRLLSLNVPLNATLRTTETELRLQGTVTPYFEGLELLVDAQGRGATEIRPIPSGDGEASFAHPVELWPETKHHRVELPLRRSESDSECGGEHRAHGRERPDSACARRADPFPEGGALAVHHDPAQRVAVAAADPRRRGRPRGVAGGRGTAGRTALPAYHDDSGGADAVPRGDDGPGGLAW